MTVGELMMARLGGRAEYADRVRFGSIILIVRDIDEHNHISSIGISMEPVEPGGKLPIFLNFRISGSDQGAVERGQSGAMSA